MIPYEGFKTYVLEEYNNLGKCSKEKKEKTVKEDTKFIWKD